MGEAGDDGAGVLKGDFGEAQEEEGYFPGESVAVDMLAGAGQGKQGLGEEGHLLDDPGFDLLIEGLEFVVAHGGFAPGAVDTDVGPVDLKCLAGHLGDAVAYGVAVGSLEFEGDGGDFLDEGVHEDEENLAFRGEV